MPTTAHITHMYLELLEYGTRAQFTQSSGPAQFYLDKEIPFYQLTVVFSDLSVHQTVLLAQRHDAEPIAWSKTLPTNRSLYTSRDIEEMDDFMVPNGLDEAAVPTLKTKSQIPRLLLSSDRPSLQGAKDYTAIYDALVHNEQRYASLRDSTSIDAIIGQLWRMTSSDIDRFGPSLGHM
jgi:RNA polymerase I-specific transcription initiation factor RRN6